jgi:hypothetical protein
MIPTIDPDAANVLIKIVSKLVTAILSWLDAANLRNRVFILQDRIVVLKTALDDVRRISSDPLVKNIVDDAIKDCEDLNE